MTTDLGSLGRAALSIEIDATGAIRMNGASVDEPSVVQVAGSQRSADDPAEIIVDGRAPSQQLLTALQWCARGGVHRFVLGCGTHDRWLELDLTGWSSGAVPRPLYISVSRDGLFVDAEEVDRARLPSVVRAYVLRSEATGALVEARDVTSAELIDILGVLQAGGVAHIALLRPGSDEPESSQSETPRYAESPNDLSRQPVAPDDLQSRLAALYPRDARERGIRGEAILRLTVHPDGRVDNVSLISEQPIGFGFGHACRQLIEGTHWTPALDRDGAPIGITTSFRCGFPVSD